MLDNHLLSHLPGMQFGSHSQALQSRLKAVDFVPGEILAEAGRPIETIVFPGSGLISIVVELGEGVQIEAGMIGRRGALGGGALFGAKHHLHTAVGQVAGRGWSMRLPDAKVLVSISTEFGELLVAQEQYLLAQARQFAACNAKHLAAQRLCSWLLRARDEAGDAELLMTQDNLGKMLGVQRATVSTLASSLQQDELITYRRGRIRVADQQGLRDRACDCQDALKVRYKQLFPVAALRSASPESARFASGTLPPVAK